jgi:hypothetical protein
MSMDDDDWGDGPVAAPVSSNRNGGGGGGGFDDDESPRGGGGFRGGGRGGEFLEFIIITISVYLVIIFGLVEVERGCDVGVIIVELTWDLFL